jgi:hypothetical protein
MFLKNSIIRIIRKPFTKETSIYKRPLANTMIELSSEESQKIFLKAMLEGNMKVL